MNINQVLKFLALICFFLALIDWPRLADKLASSRLIAGGLFLWLLSELVGGGRI